MASASSPCSASAAPSLSLRIFGLPSPMITRRQLALERGLDRGDERRRVLVAPRAVVAERVTVPVLEVDQAGLGGQRAVGSVDPVAGERAGPVELPLGRPSAWMVSASVDQAERRVVLHERRLGARGAARARRCGRRRSGRSAPSRRRPRARPAGRDSATAWNVTDAAPRPTVVDADLAPARVPVAGDRTVVVDLDPRPQVVGEAEAAPLLQSSRSPSTSGSGSS